MNTITTNACPCESAMPQMPMPQMPLAISYVPMQQFVNVANATDAFAMGTIFEDLYLNFHCTHCSKTYYMRQRGCGNGCYMPNNSCTMNRMGYRMNNRNGQ